MKKIIKNKGIFLIEAVISLGIFAIFMSLTLPLIKDSIRVRNIVKKEIRYNRNFISVMENIKKELENSEEIKILDNGNRVEIIKKIYEKQEEKTLKIVYRFSGSNYGSQFLRYVVINNERFKDDIVFENIKGKFFEEDGFIKIKISYKTLKEEEYIWR